MKVKLITHSSKAEIGFKLSGVKTVSVSDKDSCLRAWEEVIEEEDIGLILIDSFVKNQIENEVIEHQKKLTLPLVFIIPGDEKERMEGDNLTEIIRETIGIKV